jgi:hypothetical protein
VIGKTRGRNMKKRYPTVYRSGESMIMNSDGAREMKKKKGSASSNGLEQDYGLGNMGFNKMRTINGR